MASWRDYLESEGYKLLAEARNLTDVLSKDDPDEDPYRSLYQARSKFKEVKKILKKSADKRNTDPDLDYIWAVVELQLGANYVSTEEVPTGEECLQRCLDKMEQYKMTPKGMSIYLDALNQMGILWTGRKRADTALEYFKQAELLYVDYKNQLGIAPWMVEEFLGPTLFEKEELHKERASKLESLYTHTLFYFAQVYQQLGEGDISAQYCHFTLQRQLDSCNLDKLEWSLQVATLSQYYMTQRDFTMSRHCLACAEVMFQQYETSLENPPADVKEKTEQARADLQRCWVKFALGLLENSRDKLLEEAAGLTTEDASKQETQISNEETGQKKESVDLKIKEDSKVSDGTVSESSKSDKDQINDQETTEAESFETAKAEDTSNADNDDNSQGTTLSPDSLNLKSSTHEVSQKEATVVEGKETESAKDKAATEGDAEQTEKAECCDEIKREHEDSKVTASHVIPAMEVKRFNLEVTSHEEKIADKAFKTFDEAREIFLFIKKCIENSKKFYKFEHHCPDYVELVQDHSMSFKLLAFFELDMERQCKMHKRRIDMLQEILKELNPQHYLLVCRQLMFEIADTYSAMMDLKLAIIEAASGQKKPTPHNVKKINTLIMESIKHYQDYLNTLKGGKPMYPDQFPENDVRPGLVAMFCMGRLYSKFFTTDVQSRLINIKKSKECYQFLVDYCAKNPSAVKLVEAELDICKEMVVLLPGKMEKIRTEAEV